MKNQKFNLRKRLVYQGYLRKNQILQQLNLTKPIKNNRQVIHLPIWLNRRKRARKMHPK
jgi:Tfp pilus assembly major pilin PilA